MASPVQPRVQRATHLQRSSRFHRVWRAVCLSRGEGRSSRIAVGVTLALALLVSALVVVAGGPAKSQPRSTSCHYRKSRELSPATGRGSSQSATPGRASPAQFPQVPHGTPVSRLVGTQSGLSGRRSVRFGPGSPGRRVSKYQVLIEYDPCIALTSRDWPPSW